MTRISAYTTLQQRFGNEQAQALAEFIESQAGPDLSHFATKDDLAEVRNELKDDIAALRTELKEDIAEVRTDLKDLEIRLIKDISKVREDLGRDIAKVREDMISRMNLTAIIQVVTTIGALIALAKIL